MALTRRGILAVLGLAPVVAKALPSEPFPPPPLPPKRPPMTGGDVLISGGDNTPPYWGSVSNSGASHTHDLHTYGGEHRHGAHSHLPYRRTITIEGSAYPEIRHQYSFDGAQWYDER